MPEQITEGEDKWLLPEGNVEPPQVQAERRLSSIAGRRVWETLFSTDRRGKKLRSQEDSNKGSVVQSGKNGSLGWPGDV